MTSNRAHFKQITRLEKIIIVTFIVSATGTNREINKLIGKSNLKTSVDVNRSGRMDESVPLCYRVPTDLLLSEQSVFITGDSSSSTYFCQKLLIVTNCHFSWIESVDKTRSFTYYFGLDMEIVHFMDQTNNQSRNKVIRLTNNANNPILMF